jgi:uncharacterized protein with HEPN domain
MSADRLYVTHILECNARIEKYTADGQQRFAADSMIQDAVLRNLQVLAESTQKLSPTLKAKYTATDWQGINGFRNILVHAYLGIKLNRIWNVVEKDIPALKLEAQRMLADMDAALSPSPPGTIPFDP